MRNTKRQLPGAVGVELPEADRELLSQLLEEHGETATMEMLEVSRHTLARCLAKLPIQRATAEYVSRRLADAS